MSAKKTTTPKGSDRRRRTSRTAKAGPTIRQDAEKLLARTRKPYATIVAELTEKHPGSHPSVASVRWYASRMRKEGKEVPERRKA